MSWADKLGRRVAGDLEALAPGESTVEDARARFATDLVARRSQRGSTPWRGARMAMGLAAAAMILAVALVLFPRTRPEPLTFTIRTEPGIVGAWIAPRTETPLGFSDGTSVVLSASTRARVVALHADGADLVLEDGAARASVVHREKTAWTVNAGPFQVSVQGTRFLVAWEPSLAVFRLELDEGSVLVKGCHIEPRRVAAGEKLELTCAEALHPDPSPSPSESAVVDAGALEASPSGSPEKRRAKVESMPEVGPHGGSPEEADAAPAVASVRPAPPTLRERFARGEYVEAYALIDGRFDEACARADAKELALIADAARLTGHRMQARRALHLLRERFVSAPEGAVAAFHLGRLADDEGQRAEAAVWFDRYLVEAPSGELAREAEGRLIEARVRLGDRAGARIAAEHYLKLHPRGPHARVAREAIATP